MKNLRKSPERAMMPPQLFPIGMRILFHHCPKTAGTSFIRFAEDAFSPSHFILVNNAARLRSAKFQRQVERWGIHFIGGDFSPQTSVIGGPYARIGFIRKPVECLISQFCYSHRWQAVNRRYWDFFAARRGKAVFNAEDVAAYFRQYDNNLQVRFYGNRPKGAVTAATLDEAKKQLDDFALVLVADEIRESMDLFRAAFGISWRRFEHHNASNHGLVNLTRAEGEELAAEFMPFDLALYEHGRALWEMQRERLAPCPPPGGPTQMVEGLPPKSPKKMFYRALRKDMAEWRNWCGLQNRWMLGSLKRLMAVQN